MNFAIYSQVGTSERQQAYQILFQGYIDPEILKALREATKTNRVFGSERFKDQIEATIKRRVCPSKGGRPRNKEKHEDALQQKT